MKKWLSYTIDGILLAFIGVLAYTQISMLTTKSGNHGVPMAFGHSFLYVATDSMDDEPNNSIWKGNGIIIEKVNPADLEVSTPIYSEDKSTIIDYGKDGNVVTFFLQLKSDGSGVPDTHRLVEKTYNEETGKYSFKTMGDNPAAHRMRTTESWDEDMLIGRVIHHSEALGNLLIISSPDAAAMVGKTAWLLPVTVGVTILVIGGMYAYDFVKDGRKKKKAEEEEMNAKLVAAGIDMTDEAAVEAFKAKEEFKAEYRAKLEEEIEKAKKEAKKAAEKEKKGEKR